MIANSRTRGALRALNSILVLSRSLAYENRSAELVAVLDIAEYLPLLMLETEERTGEFREQLVELAKLAPLFAHSLERFDEGE
jgi:hypothetical protein